MGDFTMYGCSFDARTIYLPRTSIVLVKEGKIQASFIIWML